jgi:glucose-6-phosphate 1-dehydrogenase
MTIVIFGGAGDLAHRKLLPALYNLRVDRLLPERCAIVGVGRKAMSDDNYRVWAREGVGQFSRRRVDDRAWQEFAGSIYFVEADLESPTAFPTLGARLDTIEHERGLSGDRIYYLAVPPQMFVPIVKQLGRARFVGPPDSKPLARLVVEKPIGHDLASAQAINAAIADVFDEPRIFRIDHYLGKETVQNILVLRFANSFLEPLFNHRFIDHVQITVAEEEGVGTRASYYERAGALRDMVQNHLLQALTLVAMEPPFSLDADVVRDEKLEVIQSLRPLRGEDVDRYVVRAQYSDGARAIAYRKEQGVGSDSRTETFVALQVFIDNWRWAGVPIFLRTAKRLPKRASAISVVLKALPPILFNKDVRRPLRPNVLTIRIQPDEGFALGISSKVPGLRLTIQPAEMDFDYCRAFGTSSPEAYERLLLDVIHGDATLFMRRDAVEASWRWIMPILERWTEQDDPIATYPAGEWGPAEADQLIETGGRHWLDL